MRQYRLLVIFVMMLLTMMVFIPSYQAPNTNNPIENGFPPENWTNIGWQDSLYGAPYHGDHWAFSWVYDGKLTTPPLEFGVNTTLTFWYCAEVPNHPMSSEVYVNDTLVWYDYDFTHDDYELVTLYLDGFSGLKTISICGHLCGDFYGMCLDMITVTTSPLVVIYVDDDFNSSSPGWQYDHFNVIQDGIDAVAEGGTVYVYNGTYYENVIVNKTIELLGENKESVIIDGMDLKNTTYISADNATISGFTIKNCGHSPDKDLNDEFISGVFIDTNADNTTIKDANIIFNNNHGIYIKSSDNIVIYNNISNNLKVGIGTLPFDAYRNKINNNSIYNNSNGIYLGFYPVVRYFESSDQTSNIIARNKIYNNTFGLEINSGPNIIKENYIYGNEYGINILRTWNNKIYHNNIFSNNYNGYIIALLHEDKVISLDDGYPSGGNYWDDYVGIDINDDGIGDKPYILDGEGVLFDNFDWYCPDRTIIDGDNSGYTWKMTTSLPSWTIEPTGDVSGNMLIIDDDAAGNNNNEGYDDLCYEINCSYFSNLSVDFDGTFNKMPGQSDGLYIKVNQNIVKLFDEDAGFGAIGPVNLSPVADFKTINLSFSFYDGDSWVWGAVLDNIYVTGKLNDIYPLMEPWTPPTICDINQSTHDRGFPIRHAADGDWAGAQNWLPTLGNLTKCEIYLRKFGTPEFNLTVEIREDAIDGPVLDTLVFTPEEVPSTWTWLELDFTDVTVTPGIDYFIKCPPAPSGVTTSFGYEWGYAFGNQYDGGSFWFTRDSGNLWRDLPTMYEFVFRTYGYN
jgi:parallel beta-helix repeat protein